MHRLFFTHKIKHCEMFNFHLQTNENKSMINYAYVDNICLGGERNLDC
jgi:hypothetical protein